MSAQAISRTNGDIAYARAFSQGCDARLTGRPYSANPHCSAAERGLRGAWQLGWEDVQRNWGVQARWPVRVLPAIAPEE
jgi:hypothetical protein